MRYTYLSVVLILLLAVCGCGETDSRRNVIVIIIDTLRADHLGCYGYGRNTSPAVDSLAAEGVRWEYPTAQANWTLPAIASIYSGLSTRSHGVMMSDDYVTWGMDPEMPTMATVLSDHGYSTGGFVNVYLISERLGFHRGFQRFYVNYMGHGMAGETVDQFLQWREEDDSGRPFFTVIHLYDVHDPYDPPAPYDTFYTEEGARGLTTWTRTVEDHPADPEEKDHLMGLYDGEINWVDSQLSRVFSWLRDSGQAGNTLVVFTSDHGEAFLEREGRAGILHRSLYQEIVRVPLIMAGPGIPSGEVRDDPVGQFDIFPTLLAYLEIDLQPGLDGMDILSEEVPDDRVLPTSRFRADRASVTRSGRKVMWCARTDSSWMYDLSADPMEQHPLPPDSAVLDRVLDFYATPCRWEPTPRDSSEVKSMLRDLGYLR